MCGRFTLILEPDEIQETLGLGEMPAVYAPRYNIAPTQPVAVVTDGIKRDVTFMRWGLVPGWAKDISIGARLINARAETIQEKPSFRNAFARRRCLILADGFYEWKKQPKGPSIPFYIYLHDHKPFTFAGLWEHWQSPEGHELNTCTIITCSPNDLMADIHDRMPVILDQTVGQNWLKNDFSAAQLRQCLVPFPAENMEMHPVSRLVNNAVIEGPDLIAPLN